jgi:hypothetical protein
VPHHVLRNSVQLCAALALIASAPVQAQILPAAGRIVSVRPPGSAKIAGRPGPPKIAHYADLLQPGDRIVFAGPGTVLARVYGRDVEFKAGDQELVVPSRDVGRYSERDEDFFRGVQRFLEQPRRSIASYSYVRTPGEEGAGPPPVADPLSPVGVQYVPPNARQVGLVWRDNAASLTVRAAGQARGLDSGEGSWIVIPVPAGARACIGRSRSWPKRTRRPGSTRPRPSPRPSV